MEIRPAPCRACGRAAVALTSPTTLLDDNSKTVEVWSVGCGLDKDSKEDRLIHQESETLAFFIGDSRQEAINNWNEHHLRHSNFILNNTVMVWEDVVRASKFPSDLSLESRCNLIWLVAELDRRLGEAERKMEQHGIPVPVTNTGEATGGAK